MILISLDINVFLSKKPIEKTNQKVEAIIMCDSTPTAYLDVAAVGYFEQLISLIEKTGEKVGILIHGTPNTFVYITQSIESLRLLFSEYEFSKKLLAKIDPEMTPHHTVTKITENAIEAWLNENREKHGIKDTIILSSWNGDMAPSSDPRVVRCEFLKYFSLREIQLSIDYLKRSISTLTSTDREASKTQSASTEEKVSKKTDQESELALTAKKSTTTKTPGSLASSQDAGITLFTPEPAVVNKVDNITTHNPTRKIS